MSGSSPSRGVRFRPASGRLSLLAVLLLYFMAHAALEGMGTGQQITHPAGPYAGAPSRLLQPHPAFAPGAEYASREPSLLPAAGG